MHRAHNALAAQHPLCSRNKETPNFSLQPGLSPSCLEVQLSRLSLAPPQAFSYSLSSSLASLGSCSMILMHAHAKPTVSHTASGVPF